MSDNPRAFNTPALRSLTSEDMDHLGRAFLALTKELAIVSDRLRVLEDVLQAQSVITPTAIDRHELSPQAQQATDTARKHIVEAVMKALTEE